MRHEPDYPESEEGDFIAGIFNYCDRWCERCPMTTRCRQYAMESAMDAFFEEDDGDSNGDADDDAVEESEDSENGLDFIKSIDSDFSADFDEEDEDEEDDEEEIETFQRYREEREEDEAHPCVVDSSRYAEMAGEWMEKRTADLDRLGVDLNRDPRVRRPAFENEVTARVSDACDEILWYQHQIPIKLQRALGSRRNESKRNSPFGEGDPEDESEEFPSDADGSAKVALIGIDGSLGAWNRLRENLPEHADEIFQITLCLDQVRRLVEREFPKARAFKRPGLDD